jgi:uncharacterized protein
VKGRTIFPGKDVHPPDVGANLVFAPVLVVVSALGMRYYAVMHWGLGPRAHGKGPCMQQYQAPCEAAVPEELLRAVAEFNRGDWFECHETLEELWVGGKGELREFYQGMLQLAVAQHHWRQGNFKGALILLKGGGDLLSRVAPVCQGVDVEALRAAAGKLHAELSALGEEHMEELAPRQLIQVRLV